MPLAWIALNAAKGIGPVRISEMLKHYATPEEVFKVPPETLCSQGLIPKSCIKSLNKDSLFEQAQIQLEKAHKAGVRVVTLNDTLYPDYLKEIFAPPPVLYIKGDVSVLKKHALAIVGTRVPSSYGRQVTTMLTRDIVSGGLVVVSGMARGIDTCAHEAAINAGGKTIAVLGCGVDIIYPSSNKNLSDKICENGVLISEFQMGTHPEAYNFPRRNRIISGLSAGVLVVEAGKKSGSLITAHYALNQGREVFSVPGPITSSVSLGTFNLIKNGATPVCCVNDIIENMTVVSNLSDTGLKGTREPIPGTEMLSVPEITMLNTLSFSPMRIDQIKEKLDCVDFELFDLLLSLELKGFVQQKSGQSYIRLI
ncbi:DNA-processing protein DprA [Chitinispirillales bacterium ANBcel5]|uniref:DNA-processing protein DprA n=1 Tax=Cellulosispirillum alkaliphilum TaxID=3039283 RepID=UPI002A5830E8|nr:DNA-processing protein DprA [Chitinispirillales bacterium ANBcel5]